jgi:transcriptional regulator with XRE-family HTH domain
MPATLLHGPVRRGFPGDVGARIREARRRRGLQQRELASRANLDQPALSKYESGVHPPSIRRLWGIARALGLPVDCLMAPLVLTSQADSELYSFFRDIWFAPLAVRSAAALALRGLLDLNGGTDASGR